MAVLPEQLGEPVDLRGRFGPARARLVALLRSFAPEDWRRPTPAGAWDVTDVVAHLVGDDLNRLSRSRDRSPATLAPEEGEPFPAFLDRINERWVAAAHHIGPRVLTDLLEWSGAQVAAHWATVGLTDHDDDGVTWAGVGPGPVAWLDAARDHTEYWIHEQQLREATGRPLDDPAGAVEVLDVLARGLPFALRDVAGAEGATVVCTATDLATAWVLERRDGRWWFVGAETPGGPGASGEPGASGGPGSQDGVLAEARGTGQQWWRRWSRHPGVGPGDFVQSGDPAAARAVVDHLAIIRPDD